MVCDKCGFEHNNRSACPKCGARAIYVDEGYLKRRQEWEEAQKKGTAGNVPPGVMHSTLEERKEDTKGRSETTSLSFHVKTALQTALTWLKDKAQKLLAFLNKKFGKKRGANNPVIRDLKFDDKPDTLDESKLVLSHKVFKDNRKYYVMGAAGTIALVVVIIIVVNVILSMDRSQVMFFDGRYAYMANEPNEAIFGDIDGGIKLIGENNGDCLAYGPKGIYMYINGKATTVEADSPEIVTYSSNFGTVIYVESGKLYMYNSGESYPVDINASDIHDMSCKVSDNGKYWVITTIVEGEDDNAYALFYGNSKGEMSQLYKGDKDIEIVVLDGNGELVFMEMSTAEYGIVNDRSIKYYDGTDTKTLAEDVTEYVITQSNDLYYLNSENKLYEIVDYGKASFLDEEVVCLIENSIDDDNVYYQKDDGCYQVQDMEPVKIFEPSKSTYTLIYHEEMARIMYYDQSYFYVVDGKKENRYEIMSGTEVVYVENTDVAYILDKEGTLFKISEKNTVVSEGVTDVCRVEGVDGIAFLKENSVYINKNNNDKNTKIFETSKLNSVIYSKKRYYITDINMILWSISENGKGKDSLANVENYVLVD